MSKLQINVVTSSNSNSKRLGCPNFDSLRKVKARNVSNEFCQKKSRKTSTNEDSISVFI
jgi:hypothetical protein